MIVSVPDVHLSVLQLGVSPTTFELLCARVTVGKVAAIVAVIYQPGSETVTPSFFDDLAETLDRVAGYNEQIYVVGDLNVRLDRGDDPNSQRLTALLDVYGNTVNVSEPTHVRGGLLDVVATRSDLESPQVTVYDAGLSDHHLLQWSVPSSRSAPVVESVVHRPWHLLDIDVFRQSLLASELCRADC